MQQENINLLIIDYSLIQLSLVFIIPLFSYEETMLSPLRYPFMSFSGPKWRGWISGGCIDGWGTFQSEPGFHSTG